MSINLTGDLFQAPGALRLFSALCGELAQGRSLLVVLPAGCDAAALWSALRGELWRRDFGLREVAVDELADNNALPSALAAALGAEWPSDIAAHTPAALMACAHLPQTIHLSGLELLPPPRQRRWLDFLSQWAQAAQTSFLPDPPPALCAILPAPALAAQLPPSGPKLAIYEWWGVLSALEVRLLCRGSDSDSAIATQWREHMLSSLAGGDLALVEDLWGADLDLADLLPRLSAFGAERGWTAESLRDWGAEEWTANGLMRRYDEVARPPEAGRTLWAQGALYWTPEYGPELHTAALALLGWREELKHRCWRGQAALLLPMLDDLRLQICADLTRRYDRDWPLMWYRTGAAEEAELTADPFACEWRWLERALSYCPDRQTKGRWLEAARQARLLRNELAHYRPISFTHFSFFAQELRRPRY